MGLCAHEMPRECVVGLHADVGDASLVAGLAPGGGSQPSRYALG